MPVIPVEDGHAMPGSLKKSNEVEIEVRRQAPKLKSCHHDGKLSVEAEISTVASMPVHRGWSAASTNEP